MDCPPFDRRNRKQTSPMIRHAVFAAALVLASNRGESAEKPTTFTRQELLGYDAVRSKLDPDAKPLVPQLERAYPGRELWTEHELAALKRGGKEVAIEYHPEAVRQKGSAPRDTFTKDAANRHLTVVQKRAKSTEDYAAILRNKFGEQDYYTAEQVRDVAENGSAAAKTEGALDFDDPVYKAQQEMHYGRRGFRSPRIRESWRDLLYEEDPSQLENESKELGDLSGATFSWTHNGKANTDTWSASGALIWPWIYERGTLGGWDVETLAFAPSVGIHKVDTNGDPEEEADELLFRLGAYANWRFPTTAGRGVQVRAAAVYVTDTRFEGELPGFEIDIEPRIFTRGFPIGYANVLAHKAPLKEDGSDTVALQYQLRLWLHAEGGDVQHAGDDWNAVGGEFFRLGPVAQLRVNAPYLLFGRDVSMTSTYSYLAAVRGSHKRSQFYHGTLAWVLFKNARLGHRVSLNFDYQAGGLNFTKSKVDTFTLGLGVLF